MDGLFCTETTCCATLPSFHYAVDVILWNRPLTTLLLPATISIDLVVWIYVLVGPTCFTVSFLLIFLPGPSWVVVGLVGFEKSFLETPFLVCGGRNRTG